MRSEGRLRGINYGVVGVLAIVFGIASILPGTLFSQFRFPLIPVDLQVYLAGGHSLSRNVDLYRQYFATNGGLLPFTYPPFAALLFFPLSLLPDYLAAILLAAFSLLITFIVLLRLFLLLDRLPLRHRKNNSGHHYSPSTRAVIALLILLPSEPIWRTLSYGQINLILASLVIWDLWGPWQRHRGLLVGFATAIKLTPAIFLLYFFFIRDKRAILRGVISAVSCSLLAAVLLPQQSADYWLRTLVQVDRIGRAGIPDQQSLRGFLTRLHVDGDTALLLWVFAVLLITIVTGWVVLPLRPIKQPFQRPPASAQFLGLYACALFGLLVSPVSWTHHWVWLSFLWIGLLSCRAYWLSFITGIALYSRLHFWGSALASPVLSWLSSNDYVFLAILILLWFRLRYPAIVSAHDPQTYLPEGSAPGG